MSRGGAMGAAPAELLLGDEPDAVPRARHFATQALSGAPRAAVENAELIVAELVTNALLYGASPVTLRLLRRDHRLRIEVADTGHDLPMRGRAGRDAMTGRGLGLVALLATGWGVDLDSAEGKTVWAELVEDAEPVEGAELVDNPGVDLDALSAAWPADEPAEPVFTVELGAVPTDLLLAAKAHVDNLAREFTLLGAAARSSAERRLPPEMAELVNAVVRGFAAARSQIRRQALQAAARGRADTQLTLTLPASAADAAEQYLAALDEADRYARAAMLLTLETPPVHRVFRRWYVEAVVGQLRRQGAGLPPGPVPTFLQRLGAEVTKLVPLQAFAARLSLLQRITTELTGATDIDEVTEIVVRNATGLLGAHSARLYLLGADGTLRSAATGGVETSLTKHYAEFPAAADLPGGVALRTGRPLVVRSVAELVERFPALAGVYPDERALLVAPLSIGDHWLGVLSMTFRGTAALDEEAHLSLLTTLADVTAQALERALATAAAARAGERLAFLAEASVVLSGNVDSRSVLKAIADLVVPRLADWCAIQLVESGRLQTMALTHADPAKLVWANTMAGRYPTDMDAPTGAPNVIRTGVSEFYEDIPDELLAAAALDDEHLQALRELGMSSVITVPLTGRRGTFGALMMIYADSGRRYTEEDVSFAEDLGRRAALAVETARAFDMQSDRLAEVSRVAEAAQHAILARPPAQIGPVALAARYASAAAEALIGGDLYEVVERPSAVRLLIGDVRGKGLEAVRTATVVLGEFRAAAADLDDLAGVAAQIDRRLRRYLGDEDFVTALFAEIDDDGAYTLVSCGHPPPLLSTSSGIAEVPVHATPPLGLGASPSLTTGQFAVGDRLLLYTDGLLEARDTQGRFIEMLPLVEPLPNGGLAEALDAVLDMLRSSVGGALGDDLALLIAEYRGTSDTSACSGGGTRAPA